VGLLSTVEGVQARVFELLLGLVSTLSPITCDSFVHGFFVGH
jgi:hypothetical protein